METIGDRIRKLRNYAGISQKKLADKLKISEKTLRRYEQDINIPDVYAVVALASYFDVICLSYEQGLQKPDTKIYEQCMSSLDVKPDECLYVGDGGSHELDAAVSLGMKVRQATWYLKEGTRQPVGRLDQCIGTENPLEIVQLTSQK